MKKNIVVDDEKKFNELLKQMDAKFRKHNVIDDKMWRELGKLTDAIRKKYQDKQKDVLRIYG